MAAGLAERVAGLICGVTTKFSANWVSTLTSGRLQVGVAATLDPSTDVMLIQRVNTSSWYLLLV